MADLKMKEPASIPLYREILERAVSERQFSSMAISTAAGRLAELGDPDIDYAKGKIHEMDSFLQQPVHACVRFEDSLVRLKRIMSEN